MPELAEVEIVRRNLSGWWTSSADDVRLHDDELIKRGTPDLLDELLRSEAPDLDRRGKYLIARFSERRVIVFHFRMTGKIVKSPDPDPDYARLSWNGAPDGWLVFKDTRRLGGVEVFDTDELDDYEPLRKMGPEPDDLTAQNLRDLLPPRRRLKDALMDQSVIAGVGNIAVSELFWRLRLAPSMKANELSGEQLEALASELPAYFADIIDREMSDEVVYVEENAAQNPFDVYGREGEPCPRCDSEIARARIAGRSTYYCPGCQGEP